MKITKLLVENFRGIRRVELNDLKALIVLAGQNGSGKSCLLDAIRFIKSVYGPYMQNEFQQWFGEFQINFSDPQALSALFNDKSRSIVIEVFVELHDDERRYAKRHADQLITAQVWRTLVPEMFGWRSLDVAPFTAHFRAREKEVAEKVAQDLQLFTSEIDLHEVSGQITIQPGQQPTFKPSKLLEIVFGTFDLKHFGIIDYHGPHRNYTREQLNAINVNLDAIEEQKKQATLYNYNNKYSNVKSEMAAVYVREALSEKAGISYNATNTITSTLKDLFTTFFPDKEFLGPKPTPEGSLRFPVKIDDQAIHDLDELSSGEKEILYGYLRLRSSAPKNSIILLDEPELHLNPRLTKNLPDFYYRNLASALGNQVWLITHSDAILRGSVGKVGFSVFHVRPSKFSSFSEGQAQKVTLDNELDNAVMDLVGDLASYSPSSKIVVFEGEDSEFDVQMTADLFPELPHRANLISGTNKQRVRSLHNILEKIDANESQKRRVFSIVDKDDEQAKSVSDNRLAWDVYHIENYLLISEFIQSALCDLVGKMNAPSEVMVSSMLKNCAEETISNLVLHSLTAEVNKSIISAISLRVDKTSSSAALGISQAILKSSSRINDLVQNHFKIEWLKSFEEAELAKLHDDLQSGAWKKTFRGREILKAFSAKHVGISYVSFRNVIIARMRDAAYRPPGMEEIVKKILEPITL